MAQLLRLSAVLLLAAALSAPRGAAAAAVVYAPPALLLKSTNDATGTATLEVCAGKDGAPKGFAIQVGGQRARPGGTRERGAPAVPRRAHLLAGMPRQVLHLSPSNNAAIPLPGAASGST